MSQFSHLHVHTEYSLLDGFASVKKLFAKAGKDGMPAVAITDHGNMFGVFQFVKEAWENTRIVGKDADGKDIKEPVVKPVVGCEFYVVENRHVKTFTKDKKDNRYHQVLLAKDDVGYKNLIKLTSLGYTEGLYSKYPRIDKELIEKYHEGLIATTCCIGAYIPQTILNKGEEEAEREFTWWHNLFGDDFYIELQRHSMEEQECINATLLKFAKKYNVPVIATNDSHYIDVEDYNAHDLLLCINTGSLQSMPGFDDIVQDDLQLKNRRFKFPNNEFYFKTTSEMKQLFADIPEAIENTNAVVDKIKPLNLRKDILLPAFPLPPEFQTDADNNNNQWNYLHFLTYEGARQRYSEITEEIRERIDFELFTIKTMGFAGYFLIVSDFIKAGKEMGVFVGPGRGSAAGSVVAYCIGITNIDPVKYNLLFERFLNPDRKSMPDIDTDFDDEGRQKVIEYVVDKYGKNQVAQIITYGTMAAKMSIKDVGRALSFAPAETDMLSKLVPEKPGTILKRVLHAPLTAKEGEGSLEEKDGYNADDLERIKKLRAIYNSNQPHAQILREAEKLEGNIRNTGVHAAGIIIAPKDLMELMPVAVSKDSDLWVTQIEGKVIEEAGVIKMDFLGLKTLSILKTALELIRQNHNVEIDLDNIPLDDAKTFELYQAGETNGTFQFESAPMQKFLKELKPEKFGDLIAMNALYRPGPMAYIPKFIARKNGLEPVEYDLPEMEELLKETYGITVYQEQVMLLSQKLAGFSKGDADVLRKAMGKKHKPTIAKMKSVFVEGAKKNGHDEKIIEKIWTDWEAFAQYAFNKSHSTCYALVAFQTGYLKAHYPSEYMAAVLNHSKGASDKIKFFTEECKRMGIKILGPDINESQSGFAVNKKGEVRFGFMGISSVGDAAIESIVQERNKNGLFTDIFDFIKRINQRTVNKKALENLVYAGAFDCFSEMHRAQYFHIGKGEAKSNLEKISLFGNQYQSSKLNDTNTLFGDTVNQFVPPPKLTDCERWSQPEMLKHEKAVTGMFMSGHPLDAYQFEFAYYNILSIADFKEIESSINDSPFPPVVRIAGMVVKGEHRLTKHGKDYGVMVIEDFTDTYELRLFGETYIHYKNYMEPGTKVVILATFAQRFKGSSFEIKILNLSLLDSLKKSVTKVIEVSVPATDITSATLENLIALIANNPGKTQLRFNIYSTEDQISTNLSTPDDNGISVSDELTDFLRKQYNWDLKVHLN